MILMLVCGHRIEEMSSNGMLQHLLQKGLPQNLNKLCKVTDDKILVWKDLIIIFYVIICGLVVSTIVLLIECGCNEIIGLLVSFTDLG